VPAHALIRLVTNRLEAGQRCLPPSAAPQQERYVEPCLHRV